MPAITYPKGFTAAGAACGLKKDGAPDLALVCCDTPAVCAGLFTRNVVKGHSLQLTARRIQAGCARAVVINSGCANACLGAPGDEAALRMAALVADALHIPAEGVLTGSTGVIGKPLDMHKIAAGIARAAAHLSIPGGEDAAEAIMTTDTRPKRAVRQGDGWVVGGMAKGAGMLAPGLATMLVVITTDAVLSASALNTALREATRVSFDRLDSDGCMSTNDQVTLLASGASGITPPEAEFAAALATVCDELAAKLQADAEGASHDIEIVVVGAASEDDAVEVGRSVARNNLFKAAIFGNDPNWGRVLAAIGTTSAQFDPYDVDVWMNGVRVCTAGGPDRPREDVDLTPRATDVLIDLKVGGAAARILTNDLTHDYVHENSAYSS